MEAGIRLLDVLGTFWTLVLSALLIAGYLLLTYIRARMADRGWEKALAAKDEMIEQINDQNRELRVLTLVAGGTFTKEEATKLVYNDDRLSTKPPPARRKKR